jgi:hypothetical protein
MIAAVADGRLRLERARNLDLEIEKGRLSHSSLPFSQQADGDFLDK